MKNSSTPRKTLVVDHMWADEALKDLIAGCELNYFLRRANVCPKFIHEMDEADMFEYWKILTKLHGSDD